MTDPFAGLPPTHVHSAGATVRFDSPFADLAVPLNLHQPDPAFIRRWIQPFHMHCLSHLEGLDEPLRTTYHDIDNALVQSLLAYADWRPRLTGAIFAGVRGLAALTDHLGRLLLRSDVCIAGGGYCLTLARLGTPTCRQYLETYLDYYLRHPELPLDQGQVMFALAYIDEAQHTNHARSLRPLWTSFLAARPGWNIASLQQHFAERMVALDALARRFEGRAS